MQAQIDEACATAGIWPDAVISGHSHNYQRYMRRCRRAGSNKDFVIPYFIAGTGGIGTQAVPFGIAQNHVVENPIPQGLANSEVLYDNALKSYGCLRIKASATQLAVTFVRTDGNHRDEFETKVMDLATQLGT